MPISLTSSLKNLASFCQTAASDFSYNPQNVNKKVNGMRDRIDQSIEYAIRKTPSASVLLQQTLDVSLLEEGIEFEKLIEKMKPTDAISRNLSNRALIDFYLNRLPTISKIRHERRYASIVLIASVCGLFYSLKKRSVLLVSFNIMLLICCLDVFKYLSNIISYPKSNLTFQIGKCHVYHLRKENRQQKLTVNDIIAVFTQGLFFSKYMHYVLAKHFFQQKGAWELANLIAGEDKENSVNQESITCPIDHTKKHLRRKPLPWFYVMNK